METNTNSLNPEWVNRSIEFHGQPLQKAWEGEHGIQTLHNIGVRNPDFSLYQMRQKQFVFQDRAKRLKMHSFIAKQANQLFAHDPAKECLQSNQQLTNKNVINLNESGATDLYVNMPPLNIFLSEKTNRSDLVKKNYSQMNVGDIVYGKIQSLQTGGHLLRLLCTQPPNFHIFSDVKARAFLPHSLQVPAIDSKGITRSYITNDLVCCEIVEISCLSEKLVVGMKGHYQNRSHTYSTDIKFGLIQSNQLPEKYKFSTDSVGKTYENVLEGSIAFDNPRCIEHLSELVGLDSNTFYTNMSGLRGKYPNDEYASELRQSQASSWAFRSVADGIEHFKEGRHTEAFQCLNKALSIDSRNVEGLVARGALYANNGSLKKAVDDFELALKINSNHSNARKYMGETLVALGRNYEEDNQIEEAKKAYQDCLAVIPNHEEAKNSLNFLWNKGSGTSKRIIDMNDLSLPALNIKMSDKSRGDAVTPATSAVTANLNEPSRKESSSKKSKKKKSKGRKRHSSSSSSSDSSESSDSSTGDSSSSSNSSSSSDSDRSRSKKKKKRSEKSHQRSLSPTMSRRLALLKGAGVDPSTVDQAIAGNNSALNYSQIFGSTSSDGLPNDYELRVSKFLDMTRDDDNYEEKVRKFVEEASKYKKERKNQEEKSKKKDRKKSKKNKKDSKKKKKEKKSKSSKKDKDDVIDGNELREALKLITKLPIFDTKKLSEMEMVEKNLLKLKEEEKKFAGGEHKPEEPDSKWKMMFPKEHKKDVPASRYAFPNEDDDQEIREQAREQAREPKPSAYASTSYQSTKYESAKSQPMPPLPPCGPPILDKFGNFRRADELSDKPPEPPLHSRSRSHSRHSRSYSRSLSRSRSRSRRRSRSRSYRRSYSRSRSRSIDDRRHRRAGYYNRPRFFNNRNRFNRGFQNRDFRNNNRRWGNNNRNGWNNNNNNNNNNRPGGRYSRNFRSRSRSYSRSRSIDDRRHDDEIHKPPSPPEVGPNADANNSVPN